MMGCDVRYWGWKNPNDFDNEIEVTHFAVEGDERGAKRITVSVSEEHAMNSYNQTLTCAITLSDATARELRDHLNLLLAAEPPRPTT